MIFMSQSGLTDTSRAAAWDAWYVEHLRIMLSVPGVHSTQRFQSLRPGHPPSLAMYSIESAAVFQDPYYLSVRGMGEWLPLIDRRWYRRNLFAGAVAAPDVPPESVLALFDAAESTETLPGAEWTWLEAAGLDRSTPYRALAVVTRDAAAALPADCALYRPVTAYARKD